MLDDKISTSCRVLFFLNKKFGVLNLWLPGGRAEGTVREFGMFMQTLLYLKWVTNKDLLYSTGNSAQCYVAAWMGGEFRGEWMHVYVWPSP